MSSFNPKPFGKYFLIDKLATGGMAEIYKAKTFGVDGFEKLLAIKRILPHCSADKEFINMLIDEAKLSVLLSHTNVVQVYDLGKVGEDYFISMEFIHGVNLREILNLLKESTYPFKEELVVYIISEISKGLDYAHSKRDPEGNPLNIVHRDISPQNILISFEGEVKIVDFGIAKAAMNISHTMAGILKGKISYMSPEQALGKPIDHRTDIFSTGLMLYELLTGEKFFQGETQFEVLKKIRSTRIDKTQFPETISEPIREILAKALAYSTNERYPTAGDFQIDLTRYLYTTYPDFTPRKLSKFMRDLFAEEIASKQNKEKSNNLAEPKTESALVSSKAQENIVHREGISSPRIASGTATIQANGQNSGDAGMMDDEVTGDIPITSTDESSSPSVSTLGEESLTTPPEDPANSNKENSENSFSPPPIKTKKSRKWLYPIAALVILGAGLGAAWKSGWLNQFIKEPVPANGIVQIQSTPQGAQILINGQNTGKTTPTTLENLAPNKPLQVRLEKEKYKSWSKQVTPQNEIPLKLEPTLEVIPVGSLIVRSEPPGAKIFLDAKDTGFKTPTTLEDLPLSKTYTLRLEKEKYHAEERRITVYSIEPLDFLGELEPILYASLKVSSNPTGAEIFLNNQDTGKKTPATFKDLEVGELYQIKLKRGGYQELNRTVEITQEGEITFNQRLSKIAPPTPPAEQKKTQEKLEQTAKKAAEKLKELKKQTDANLKKQAEKTAPTKTEEPKKTTTNNVGTVDHQKASLGVIVIDSNPSGAMVLMNGSPQQNTPLRIKGLTPGRNYTFTVKKSGYRSWSRSITVGQGSKSFMANLKKI